MSFPLNQRVAVFVDVQNMFYAAKHLYNSKLNFGRLLEYIARDRNVVRAISYVVQTPDNDQSNFLAMLRSNGYEIRSKELKMRPDGSAKGDWDMGLALDALAMSDRLDTVAIVSGDGDFVELVNFLKARGVRVEVYSFPYSTAEELRYAATEYYQMGQELVMNPARAGFPTNGERYDVRGEGRYSPRSYDDQYESRYDAEGQESETGSELFSRKV